MGVSKGTGGFRSLSTVSGVFQEVLGRLRVVPGVLGGFRRSQVHCRGLMGVAGGHRGV